MEQSQELYNALINSVAHELRTPLTSITAAIEMLTEEELVLSAEDRREMVQIAFDETKRLNQLIDNLLLDARLHAGVVTVQKGEASLSTIVRKVVSRISSPTLFLEIQEDLPLVMFDGVLMERAVRNLIQNAVRQCKQSPVAVQLFTKDQELIFKVSYCDRAIPPGHEQIIFEDFYQVKHGSNDELGITFSLSRKIIEAHDGRIWSANLPNGEICFCFALPVMDTPVDV